MAPIKYHNNFHRINIYRQRPLSQVVHELACGKPNPECCQNLPKSSQKNKFSSGEIPVAGKLLLLFA